MYYGLCSIKERPEKSMSDQIASGAEDKSGKIAQMFVSAKVTIPKTFQYQVDRPRLYHQLDGWQTVRGIIVHAAAGYGKSTLASGWLASSECRAQTAWLSLDQYDSEPRQFIRALAAALDLVMPGLAEVASALLTDEPPSDQQGLM